MVVIQIRAYREEAEISEDEQKRPRINPNRVSVEGIKAPVDPYLELVASHNSTSCQEDA